MYPKVGKRVLDISIALILLAITAPILLISTMALLFANRGKVFFRQTRLGLNARLFPILKFKTMNDRVDATGKLLPDAQRLTRVGKFIRSTSIDELPQLFNVLKGEMSLIGPRPLLVKYLDRYTPEQARRHEVKPGITGWAQVNGRNTLSWEDKFKYDVWYVDHVSFTLDLKIIGMTIRKVLKRADINSNTTATMEEFKGTTHK